MSLAQVVYNISTDNDFAALWRNDPEAALARKGLRLSKEELDFLRAGLHRNSQNKVRLSDILVLATNWRI